MTSETKIYPDQPVITTERFVLRPPQASDAGPVGLYAGDRRVAENTSTIPHPLPPGAVETFIERSAEPERTEDVWVIDGTPSGMAELLGVIGLKRMDRAQSEVGYWIVPAFWNAGIASEAVRGLLAANPHGARTIFADVFQSNPASARVLTNAGFKYLGDAETYCVSRGSTVDTWTYLRDML